MCRYNIIMNSTRFFFNCLFQHFSVHILSIDPKESKQVRKMKSSLVSDQPRTYSTKPIASSQTNTYLDMSVGLIDDSIQEPLGRKQCYPAGWGDGHGNRHRVVIIQNPEVKFGENGFIEVM